MGDMDRQKIEQFLDRFIGLASGATTIGLLAVADRSGLSGALARRTPATSAEIAEEAALEERYVSEILSGLAAAGVVDYDPETREFALPAEHALFLADETSPYFMGGWLDMLPAVFGQVDGVAHATVHGGGVGFEEFGPMMVRGIDRGNSPSMTAFLVKRWLPAVPGLVERLQEGIRVADIGTGSGTAVVEMARAFPNSQIHGFDVSQPSIDMARSRAGELPNAHFEVLSIDELSSDPGFDLITTFDVVHDLTDPLAGLVSIRKALRPEGRYLMMEPNASSDLADNLHDRGALLYGISALHCMTQSLASGGPGLGAAWGRERAQDLAEQAGFSTFQPLGEITNRFSAFYLLRP